MGDDVLEWLPLDRIEALLAAPHGELLLASVLFVVTALLVVSCVPGMLMPISFSSGALIGGLPGIAVVVAGAALGSQALFVVVRSVGRERVRRRYGERIGRFGAHFARRGLLYVVGLRVIGAPHFLVTACCALAPLRPRAFAAASVAGFLPAVTFAALAGSLV